MLVIGHCVQSMLKLNCVDLRRRAMQFNSLARSGEQLDCPLNAVCERLAQAMKRIAQVVARVLIACIGPEEGCQHAAIDWLIRIKRQIGQERLRFGR